MRGVSTFRIHRSDLLARPPCGVRTYEDGVTAWIVDPVEQLEELADLLSRGLMSRDGVRASQGQGHRRLESRVSTHSSDDVLSPPSSSPRSVPPVDGWCRPARPRVSVAPRSPSDRCDRPELWAEVRRDVAETVVSHQDARARTSPPVPIHLVSQGGAS